MKKHQLKTLRGEQFIDLSEQLRFELEAQIDILWLTGRLAVYFEVDFKLELLNNESELIINCLKDEAYDNHSAALTICKAIKVWYGMYYDDRLSVLAKFDSICNSHFNDSINDSNTRNLRFIPFFMIELAKILTEIRWNPICDISYD